MKLLIDSNPKPRSVTDPKEEHDVQPNSVGEDLSHYVQRSELEDRRPLQCVVTLDQWIQTFKVLDAEFHAGATMIIDVVPDAVGSGFGLLLLGSLRSTIAALPLHSLARNLQTDIPTLLDKPLAEILGWVANGTITTFFGSRRRWDQFLEFIGLPDSPVNTSFEKADVILRAVQDGRVQFDLEQITNENEASALLSWAYCGRSMAPVTEEEYDAAFPGVARPGSRDFLELFDWPHSTEDSPEFLTLDQAEFSSYEVLPYIKSILDLVCNEVTSVEARKGSQGTPQTCRDIYQRSLVPEHSSDVNPLLTIEYAVDYNAFGHNLNALRKEIKAAKKLFRHHFGQVCLGEVSLIDAPLGMVIRVELLGKACSQCGEVHGMDRPPCNLSRRMLRKEVSLDEQNCEHCAAHDHLIKACPVLHNRCRLCGCLGHIAELCRTRTMEQHFRKFLASCCHGMYTSLERYGPVYGPFGFGGPLRFAVDPDLNYTIQETGIMMASRFRYASKEELTRRKEAVRYVMSNVRRINLFYLEEKHEDESWTSYLGSPGKAPSRSTTCLDLTEALPP